MSARSARSFKTDSCRRLTSAQLEELLVRKRQAEFERQNFWNNSSTYFRAWNFNTAQYSNWTSNEFYDNRTENMRKMEMKKKKQENLIERRKKLKDLLDKEEEDFQTELKNLSKREEFSLEDLQGANIELLLREEEKRRKERDIKLYHHWRQNQPAIRALESKQHNDFVKRSWMQQVIEKRKEREAEERKAMELIENIQKLQEEQNRKEQEMQLERKKTEEELKNFLEKQIELIKCKEEQEKILKKEEISTLKVQAELEVLLEERKKVEERRKRKELSLFHKRQYLVLLKKRALEVKDDLETDRQFLEKLTKEEEEIVKERDERTERFRKELALAKEAFSKQAEIEKLKSKQCEFLFEEEAKDMLQKQEAQWRAEEEARNKLMNEVLKMLQVQIQEKLLQNLKEQEDARRCRQDMIIKMEEANLELKEYREKTKAAMESWKKDLDQQILEKKMQIFKQKKKEEEDKENELRARREEQEKLFKELSRMNILGYKPKDTSRRRLLPL